MYVCVGGGGVDEKEDGERERREEEEEGGEREGGLTVFLGHPVVSQCELGQLHHKIVGERRKPCCPGDQQNVHRQQCIIFLSTHAHHQHDNCFRYVDLSLN